MLKDNKKCNSKLSRLKYIIRESYKRSDGNWFWTIYIIVKEQVLCRFGTSSFDYYTYDLYKLSYLGRKEFINQRKSQRIRRYCNEEKACKYLRDKSLFNEKFNRFLHRDWLDLRNASFADFKIFIKRHNQFIVKPQDEQGGKGIFTQVVAENSDLLELYNELVKKQSLIEEEIVQANDFAKFNEESVNTIRVVTLLTKPDDVKFISATFRMGTNNNCTDNFHTGGIAAEIDIDTGIIVTHAVDRNMKGYYIHPKTGYQIIGYRIPLWKEILKCAKEAALEVPAVRYVGWDIAVNSKNEIIIIEGNDNASRDIQQMPGLKGMWFKYSTLLKK